jgi:hypothetical protein
LNDPKPIADFLERSFQEKSPTPPDFVAGAKFERHSYYALTSTFESYPQDGWYITKRGAAFAPTYDRYEVSLGYPVPVTIIAPRQAAAGRPWVFRAGYVSRDARVDQELLARGFHIVVGPLGFNSEGPEPADWDRLYKYLTDHGFSARPVMEGEGGAAGPVYEWSINNPDKVACIYSENAILRAPGVKAQPIDNLAPLAKAGVALMDVCGSLDPALNEQTRVLERRYKDMNGSITVLIEEGVGHFTNGPRDPRPIVDFIVSQVSRQPKP